MKNYDIKKGIRYRILERDHFQCQYCGRKAPEVTLHVDHIQPRSKGGSNHHTNLITACQDCNIGKSDLQQIIASDRRGPLQQIVSLLINDCDSFGITSVLYALESLKKTCIEQGLDDDFGIVLGSYFNGVGNEKLVTEYHKNECQAINEYLTDCELRETTKTNSNGRK